MNVFTGYLHCMLDRRQTNTSIAGGRAHLNSLRRSKNSMTCAVVEKSHPGDNSGGNRQLIDGARPSSSREERSTRDPVTRRFPPDTRFQARGLWEDIICTSILRMRAARERGRKAFVAHEAIPACETPGRPPRGERMSRPEASSETYRIGVLPAVRHGPWPLSLSGQGNVQHIKGRGPAARSPPGGKDSRARGASAGGRTGKGWGSP